ncbi:hypothetical protein R1sor_018917 [Riccia sorocarpa]|uniref:Pentatricopeptide repeat-containing protein n=1 Tax=Riccia sorocarpa TaxID=122646 RepID=A0ABD3IEV3_9MARC
MSVKPGQAAEEDVRELKLGEDLTKSITKNAEVTLILQTKYDQLQSFSEDAQRTRFLKKIAQFSCISRKHDIAASHLFAAFGGRFTVRFGFGRGVGYIRSQTKGKEVEREWGDAQREDEEAEEEGAEVWEEFHKSGNRAKRLPIESNGPPPLILHPYISEEKPVNVASLRPLPLPSPHKIRPPRLPRPSIRRKLTAVGSNHHSNHQVVKFVKQLATQIQSLPDDVPVSELLDEWVWKLKRGALAPVVTELGQMQLTERVLQLFACLQQQPHLWPDDVTLSAIINVMVETGEVEIAAQLQRDVGRDSPRAAQALASSLVKVGLLEESIQVLNYMINHGWKVDGFVYSTITHWACRAGARDSARRLWKNVNLSDVKWKLHDYTSIMASCSKLGLYDPIDRLYREFTHSGLKPNIILYTTLLSVLSRQSRYREAVALFWEMEEAGCEPDLMAYEVMLDVCAKLEDLTKALKVYRDLKNAGYTPTPSFYNKLIQLLVNKGSLSKAREMTREMSSRGYTPSAETLSCLSLAAP